MLVLNIFIPISKFGPMAKLAVLDFLAFCSSNTEISERLIDRNLSELIFHAKALNFHFTVEELTAVLGSMEWHVITVINQEELNAYSSLWPKMWGKSRLQYVIDELFLSLGKEKWVQLLLP